MTTDSEASYGQFTVFTSPECEKTNLVYYFAKNFQNHMLEVDLSFFKLKNLQITPSAIQILKAQNLRVWQKKFQSAVSYNLGRELNSLFDFKDKRDQIIALENLKLNSEVFFSFLIQAGDSHGYRYSRYITQHRPLELENKKYPKFLYRESKDRYITFGETDLSYNQLRVSLDLRRRTIADFVDRDGEWHCFFRTLSGIYGKEIPHVNEPHIHYISSSWGIQREKVIEQLRSYRYKLPSIFIPFEHIDDEI